MGLKESIPAALPTRTGTGNAYLAGGTPDTTTTLILINRIRQRCAVSEAHAATIVRLAGLGPVEVRA